MVAHAQKPFLSFGETDEFIEIYGGVISIDCWYPECAHEVLLVVMLEKPCSEIV